MSATHEGIDTAHPPELTPAELFIQAAAIALMQDHPNAAIPGRNLLNLVAKQAEIIRWFAARTPVNEGE